MRGGSAPAAVIENIFTIQIRFREYINWSSVPSDARFSIQNLHSHGNATKHTKSPTAPKSKRIVWKSTEAGIAGYVICEWTHKEIAIYVRKYLLLIGFCVRPRVRMKDVVLTLTIKRSGNTITKYILIPVHLSMCVLSVAAKLVATAHHSLARILHHDLSFIQLEFEFGMHILTGNFDSKHLSTGRKTDILFIS